MSAFTGALVTALVAVAVYLYLDFQAKNTLTPFANTNCTRITGEKTAPLWGPEDIIVHDDIILTGTDDRAWMIRGRHMQTMLTDKDQGAIFAMDLRAKEPKFVKVPMKGFPGPDFHPHGIGLLREGRRTYLFVVNHRRNEDAIEVFEWLLTNKDASTAQSRVGTLRYLYSSVDPAGHRELNDVVPVSTRSYYTTNWLSHEPNSPMMLYEVFTFQPWNFVLFCEIDVNNATKCVKAAENIVMPNGINVSPDKNTLYVNAGLARQLLVYDRHQNNSLSLRTPVDISFAADNVDVTENGDVYLAGQLNIFACYRHLQDISRSGNPVPGKVVRIRADRKDPTKFTQEVVFADDGHVVRMLTGAAFHRGKLYLGTVLEEGLVVCDAPHIV
eukprot:GILK01002245.1.p1 GENE.GILK01002245.1~~GILK01002245.1.p1  ORF type:complete len:399 (+),score=61.61 GILK01002245.1:43-1197(+)